MFIDSSKNRISFAMLGYISEETQVVTVTCSVLVEALNCSVTLNLYAKSVNVL